jgi:hypothetical protein
VIVFIHCFSSIIQERWSPQEWTLLTIGKRKGGMRTIISHATHASVDYFMCYCSWHIHLIKMSYCATLFSWLPYVSSCAHVCIHNHWCLWGNQECAIFQIVRIELFALYFKTLNTMLATLHCVMYLHVTDLWDCHVNQPFWGLLVLSYPYTHDKMGRRIEIIW